ncbi:MAG: SH3 domain-containing protein [Gemmatimonadales bacterium]
MRSSDQSFEREFTPATSYMYRLIATIAAASVISVSAALSQETPTYIATKATIVRTAPVTGTPATPAVGQIAQGAPVEVIARDKEWVRIRLEGWVRESDLVVADTTLRALSAADIRANPAAALGKLVRWEVEIVALQMADALRTGLQKGEHYFLALGPGPEKTLVYIAVPPGLLANARSLPPLAQVIVTARVRNGRSEPAGVPILDLQSLTRK